jgi:hypothetical protein
MALRRRTRRPRLSSRRRPASAERIAENRRALKFYAAVGVGAALLLALAIFARPRPVDKTTGCETDQLLPKAHTVLVIDQTDAFTPAQITYAKKVLLYEYDRLHRYDLLTVRGVGDDADTPFRNFKLCRVQKRAEVYGIAVNEDQVARRFETVAGKPMARYLDSLARVGEAETSPLVETLSNISREEDFGPGVGSRRLVVISDLAQNSANFSQYRNKGAKVALPTELGVFRADLKGATVRVHYLLRPSLRRLQGPAHQATWQDYFERAGAKDIKIGWGVGLGDTKR